MVDRRLFLPVVLALLGFLAVWSRSQPVSDGVTSGGVGDRSPAAIARRGYEPTSTAPMADSVARMLRPARGGRDKQLTAFKGALRIELLQDSDSAEPLRVEALPADE